MQEFNYTLNLFELNWVNLFILLTPLILFLNNFRKLQTETGNLAKNRLVNILLSLIVLGGLFLSRFLIMLMVALVFDLLVEGYQINYWMVFIIVVASDLAIWKSVDLFKFFQKEKVLTRYILTNFLEFFLIFLFPFLIGSIIYFIR